MEPGLDSISRECTTPVELSAALRCAEEDGTRTATDLKVRACIARRCWSKYCLQLWWQAELPRQGPKTGRRAETVLCRVRKLSERWSCCIQGLGCTNLGHDVAPMMRPLVLLQLVETRVAEDQHSGSDGEVPFADGALHIPCAEGSVLEVNGTLENGLMIQCVWCRIARAL